MKQKLLKIKKESEKRLTKNQKIELDHSVIKSLEDVKAGRIYKL